MKKPLTPSGIESATFRFVAQHLNHCATAFVAQRVGRSIALLFHDRDTRRGWVVSSTPRQHFSHGKHTVPILQEAGWASGPVWTGGKSRPHRDSIPDRPARSQSLYRLSYPAHRRYIGGCRKLKDQELSNLHYTQNTVRTVTSDEKL